MFFGVVITGTAVAKSGGTSSGTQLPIDFSSCGYAAGRQPLPVVSAVVAVAPSGKDDTATIQAAIDRVARRKPDKNGFRGAVLLHRGLFRIHGELHISSSGIVLRGSGSGPGGSHLLATGVGRRPLIMVGNPYGKPMAAGRPVAITEPVPAGATTLTIANLAGIRPGSSVQIRRPSTKAWIHTLGMDAFTGHFHTLRLDWHPGSRDLLWNRVVTSVDTSENRIHLDAPITVALTRDDGLGSVSLATDQRIDHIGIENLTLDSVFNRKRPHDEDHSWTAIHIDNVENAWIRGIAFRHFAGSAVFLGSGAKYVTVTRCASREPVSEIAGYRRLTYYAGGQLCLFYRCSAEDGRRDFVSGICSPGPNAFVDCHAIDAHENSGTFESWSAGTLFDNVTIQGGKLLLDNRHGDGQGAGWTAVSCILWNCKADALHADSPPGAHNWIISNSAEPSIYKQQVEQETHAKPVIGELADFPLPPDHLAVEPYRKPDRHAITTPPLKIVNGRFSVGGRAVWGGALSNAWWKGQIPPETARHLGFSLTRFAPDRYGPGLIESLPGLANKMETLHRPLMQDWRGLWYERRRDAHITTREPDANAWAPFYEMPWSRSGRGTAWDGLSKYDLARFNPWYFERIHDFAALCRQRGLILVHSCYNNHNLIENPAHWVDFPWRPANCIQKTGFPKPPPFRKNGTEIRIADQFYDLSNTERKRLNRLFIRHTLNALGNEPNLILTLGFQYSGPVSFQKFFLRTVKQWETQHHRKVKIALTAAKNVTDAILGDPEFESMISVIDMRYWQLMPGGHFFAPPGGANRAFREMRVDTFGDKAANTPPPTTPEMLYREVRQYHDRFPDKALICFHGGQGPIPILMAGGAIALLTDSDTAQPMKLNHAADATLAFIQQNLTGDLCQMKPVDGLLTDPAENWCLADRNRAYLIASCKGAGFTLNLSAASGKFVADWFDPKSGSLRPMADLVDGGGSKKFTKPGPGLWLLWLHRKDT